MIQITLKRSLQDDILRFNAYANVPFKLYGMSAWAGRRLVGMAGVAKLSDDGRYFGYCFRVPGYEDVLGRGLHRHALRFIDHMRRAGVPAIYATIQDDVPKAQKWLDRLNFMPTLERFDGDIVYRLDLGATSDYRSRSTALARLD